MSAEVMLKDAMELVRMDIDKLKTEPRRGLPKAIQPMTQAMKRKARLQGARHAPVRRPTQRGWLMSSPAGLTGLGVSTASAAVQSVRIRRERHRPTRWRA